MSTRTKKLMSLMVVAILGIWGCAKTPTGSSSAEAERIKSLEAKHARLMDDFRAAAAARDQLRQKLASAEELYLQTSRELDQLHEVVQERDQLREDLMQRTCERDATQVQFEEFRSQIRSLLGQAELAAQRPLNQPVVSARSTLSLVD